MTSARTQAELCNRYCLQPDIPDDTDKLGIALGTLNQMPLNGLRHPPELGTCGWYIWGGDSMPTADDAFVPLHVDHLDDYCPLAVRFLGLPAGWRFLTDGENIDVWEDSTLLEV